MKKFNLCILSCIFTLQFTYSQISVNSSKISTSILIADKDLSAKNECSQENFGGHFKEFFDEEINSPIFQFETHNTSDNYKCENFKKYLHKIKFNVESPESLLGAAGETVTYTWKFKLDKDFLSSTKKAMDVHQLKAVGGSEQEIPLFSLTTVKGRKSDQLELRYTEMNEQITLKAVDLAAFKGNWVEVSETITYGEIGAYDLVIKNVTDDTVLLDYSKGAIRTWKTDAEYIRPKWGLYRDLNDGNDVRNEIVRFANFNIEESNTLDLFKTSLNNDDIKIFPNPASEKVTIQGSNLENYDTVILHDSFGREIQLKKPILNNSLDVTSLKNGIYFIVFKKDKEIKVVKKLLKF